MNSLYSLYDALVSINVPNEKARAVVDALERDMGTTLVTKADLDAKYLLLRQELDNTRTLLRQEIDSARSLLTKDMEALRSSMIIWLGSIQVIASGVLFAALRLT